MQPKLQTNYTPYSLKDYRTTKPLEYYELGGLGAYNLGTEEWKKQKEQLDRRTEYARQLHEAHKALPPAKLRRPERHSEQPMSGRQRAIEFSKGIPRPKLKFKDKVQEINQADSLTELERLEQLHSNYEATVSAIRANYS